ncbi:MAG TPA: hypothetical protein VE991_10025 [Acidimicrobiales bacterium]|nr:hypothetical protein [Acidimicrobiales bacterium]
MIATLPVPAEPVARREELRAELLAGADWEGAFGPELGVGDVLWDAWGDALRTAGLAREAFAAVVQGYRREIWFWILGDRVWDQVATGLAGRLQRRLPSA